MKPAMKAWARWRAQLDAAAEDKANVVATQTSELRLTDTVTGKTRRIHAGGDVGTALSERYRAALGARVNEMTAGIDPRKGAISAGINDAISLAESEVPLDGHRLLRKAVHDVAGQHADSRRARGEHVPPIPKAQEKPLIDAVQAALGRPDRLYGTARAEPAQRPWIERHCKRMRTDLNHARIFRLSSDFTKLAQRASLEQPTRLWNALAAARPPYEITWIEWEQRDRSEATAEWVRENSGHQFGIGERMQCGMLIFPGNQPPGTEDGEPTFFVTHTWTNDSQLEELGPFTRTWLWPHTFAWDIERPLRLSMPAAEMVDVGMGDDVVSRAEPFGQGYYDLAEKMHPERAERAAAERCRRHTGVGVNPFYAAFATGERNEFLHGMYGHCVTECEGDLRFVIAVLALLQEKWVVHEPTRIHAGHRLVGGRPTKYLDHHTLVVVAPKERRLGLMQRAMRNASRKRRHDVHGHWCTRANSGKSDAECSHTYVRLDDERRKQTCTICGRERWWRKPHERGDAMIGFVTKTYSVISPREAAKKREQGARP